MPYKNHLEMQYKNSLKKAGLNLIIKNLNELKVGFFLNWLKKCLYIYI